MVDSSRIGCLKFSRIVDIKIYQNDQFIKHKKNNNWLPKSNRRQLILENKVDASITLEELQKDSRLTKLTVSCSTQQSQLRLFSVKRLGNLCQRLDTPEPTLGERRNRHLILFFAT